MTQDFMIRSTVHCNTKRLERALSFKRSLAKKMHHILKEKAWIKKAPRFEGKRLKPDVGFAARFALSPVGG